MMTVGTARTWLYNRFFGR